MRIGNVFKNNIDDNSGEIYNKHVKNAYLYRLDTFLTEYKKSLHFNIRSKNIKNLETQKKKILRIDKKIFELQFCIPFIHLNTDIETYIENNEFKINKNVNIMILEDEIKKADIEIIKLSHDKLTKYLKELFEDKRTSNLQKNLILSNVNTLTYKDYLAYSYLYRLNNILNNDKSISINDNIPGVIFKSIINNKIHKSSNLKKENVEIIIDIVDILKASEEELQLAHQAIS